MYSHIRKPTPTYFNNQYTVEASIVRFSLYFKQGYRMVVIIFIEQKAQVLNDFK